MKRLNRAHLAVAVLLVAGFMFIDAYAYGADEGYKVALVLAVAGSLTLVALGLFAWNVLTYKR